jgi:hypothetical protein
LEEVGVVTELGSDRRMQLEVAGLNANALAVTSILQPRSLLSYRGAGGGENQQCRREFVPKAHEARIGES